jgi:hypothetical protein
VSFKDGPRVERDTGQVAVLGVQNFGAQRDFYRRLGWPQAFDSDDFAVFELRGALWRPGLLTVGFFTCSSDPLTPFPGEDAMSKVVYWMTVSLDGFVETRDGNIDWTMPDERLFRFHTDYARQLGAFLYGRRT